MLHLFPTCLNLSPWVVLQCLRYHHHLQPTTTFNLCWLRPHIPYHTMKVDWSTNKLFGVNAGMIHFATFYQETVRMTKLLVGFPCGFQVTSDFDIQMPVGPRNKSKGYAFIQVEQSETMVALARCLWSRNMPMRASPIPLKIQPAQRVTETSESSEVPAADYAEHAEPPAAASLARLPPSAGYSQQSGFQFQWVTIYSQSSGFQFQWVRESQKCNASSILHNSQLFRHPNKISHRLQCEMMVMYEVRSGLPFRKRSLALFPVQVKTTDSQTFYWQGQTRPYLLRFWTHFCDLYTDVYVFCLFVFLSTESRLEKIHILLVLACALVQFMPNTTLDVRPIWGTSKTVWIW